MGRLLKRYDQIVTLNVDGQMFSTTAQTLTREEDLFTELLYGQHTDSWFTGPKHNSQSLAYYDQFPAGTRVAVWLDMDVGTLEYVVDGQRKGEFRRQSSCTSTFP